MTSGRGREKGAAAVEMAIVSMFLLVLLLGIVDIGRAITTNISLRDAVQEGASYAAYTEDVSDASIQNKIINSVSSPNVSTASFAMSCIEESRELQGGSIVTIDVTYDVDLITPIVGTMLGGSITLSPSAEADRFFETCSGITSP